MLTEIMFVLIAGATAAWVFLAVVRIGNRLVLGWEVADELAEERADARADRGDRAGDGGFRQP